MNEKRNNRQREIGAANMLRFYDTGLIERLNKRFNESSSRYEHKNHFLTDLIEAGLDRREYENSLRDELLKNDAAMYKSVDELAGYLIEFEKYVRTQFQTVGAAHYLIKAFLSNIYSFEEARNQGVRLPSESVGNGTYDDMPERFAKLKKTVDEVFIKNG